MSEGGQEIPPGMTTFVPCKANVMELPGTDRKVDALYLEKAISYQAYIKLIGDLLAEGKTTGPNQSEAFIHYTQLNQQRMHRLEKTTLALPTAKESILTVTRPQTWLVLTEAWCGDAAQSVPVMQVLAQLNPLIDLRLLLRDENPGLMDQFLTNGVSRSIPKLIALDTATGSTLFTWGPRPAALQELFLRMKAEGTSFDTAKEELQRWYNTDRTASIQSELAGLAAAATIPG
jgi:Thioredoxin